MAPIKELLIIVPVILLVLIIAGLIVGFIYFEDKIDFGNAPAGECIVTGCSGQLCSDEEVVTTCEYREEYACYKDAVCERQSSGNCGWTLTAELNECLSNQF